MLVSHSGFELDDNRERIDFEQVHKWLSSSYWSPGVARERVERAAAGSALVVGAYSPDGQIGYLRVVSDKTTFAWLADVFVDESFRGRGVASAMTRFAQQHPDFPGLRRWVLATRDAHKVYAGCGFVPLNNPERWMIYLPNPVRGVDECR